MPNKNILALTACISILSVASHADSDAVFNDPMYLQQSFLQAYQLPEVWKSTDGSGVTVAVIDNGFWPTDPDLEGKYLPDEYVLTGDHVFHSDSIVGSAHGSSVAATIAAIPNNGIGFVGIAPGTKILRLRTGVDRRTYLIGQQQLGVISNAEKIELAHLMSNGEAQQQDHQAYLATLKKHLPEMLDWCIARGARVVNMSWSLASTESEDLLPVREAFQKAVKSGVILVAAAGNYMGPWNPEKNDWEHPLFPDFRYDRVQFPAAFPEVLSAGSFFDQPDDMNMQIYERGSLLGFPPPWNDLPARSSTMYGDRLDFVLPIKNVPVVIRSRSGPIQYTVVRGASSNAAPQLSAISALLLSRNPSLTLDSMKTLLAKSATNKGTHTPQAGFGLIDVKQAFLTTAEAK